jgi:cellulose synthase operon protein YhjQ
MTDRKALTDQNETPEDVATLYSWANLHGAKYRDFSASRAQTREKARQRVQEAIEVERRRAHEEAEAQKVIDAQRAFEAARAAEVAARQAEARQAEEAAQQAAEQSAQLAIQQAAQQRAWQQQAPPPAPAPRQERYIPAPQARPVQPPAPYYQAPQPQPPQQREYPAFPPPQSYQEPQAYSAPPASPAFPPPQAYAAPAPAAHSAPAPPAYATPAPQAFSAPAPQAYPAPAPQAYAAPQPYTPPQQYRPARESQQPQYGPAREPREESFMQPRPQWAPPEPRESIGRPAWLASDRADLPSQPVAPAPEDTLQGSRDRMTSRWFALKGVFEGASAPPEVVPPPVASRAPVLAVFSLAGGVGKTSLVATLGRALSARGERVLLVDTAAYGLLPFFFGARDQRPGQLRTFSPPGSSGDAPIQMVTIDPETMGPETATQETLTQEISRHARGVSRVIIDLATASGATTRRVMRMNPTILVPVIADMNSVVSVSSIDGFFQHNSKASGKQVTPYYVLNQFDPSLPLHLDVREVLREQLGDRLLPFALRRAPAVSEALAEGMTVMDYAPNSTVAEDFGSLAGWVKSLAAPAGSGYRGVRWSER